MEKLFRENPSREGGEEHHIHEENKRLRESTVKNDKMTDIIEHCDLRDNISSMKQSIVPTNRSPLFSPRSQLVATVDEVDNRDYRMEEVRLRSYSTWPVPFLDPAKMAAAGFYYTGEGDKAKCFECKVDIGGWVEGDNPMTEHQRWQEQCRFIRKIPCGNVPIGENPNSIPQPRPRGHDVCGPYGIEYRPGSVPDCHTASSDIPLPSTAKLGSLGIGRPKGPAHPEYASYDARLSTFKSWPKSMPQTKECLADAGFWYTGRSDQTICYHCGGGLKDWEPTDDPWEQHAQWFSKCYYLLMVKGQAYVNTVTGQTISLPSNEETMQMNLPSYIKKVEPKVSSEKEKDGEKSSNAGPSAQSSSTSVNSLVEGSRSATVDEKSSPQKVEAGTTSQENAKKPIDDARLCKICYGEELGVVFLPCGHMVSCVKCAPGMVTCALCRQSVSMTVRAFFS
ncbi:baculoviral IAP repeat-containing protein 7-B-like isoform X2 [Venturia canescens]|uniref:baculoviral IAP repeat-containing protein 7-B-like isoform X2 n=1 Tax=Venturia canescens TaxID=32260 RepID=UPI001C9BE1D3|nr:baculoviral IAP repeat-containing protein 7-B-like isoform X2 [Venturia canescens]